MSPVDTAAPVEAGAVISDCGLYRYRLWRRWAPGERMAWIMLNPSTADDQADDPTIRRCITYARREGYGGIEVINLYALRATKPRHLLDHPDPEGPANLNYWDRVLLDHTTGMIVAAWGASRPIHCPPSKALNSWFVGGWYCLGRTSDGHPRHPLYVPADQPLVPLT